MVTSLKKQYASPEDAKGRLLQLRMLQLNSSPVCHSITRIINPSACESSLHSSASGSSLEVVHFDTLKEQITGLPAKDQLLFLSDLLCSHAKKFYGIVVPNNFVKLCLLGMKNLEGAGRTNIIYSLSKGLGTTRPDGSDCFIPTKRMPFGLLQYVIQFFISKPGQHVSYTIM